MLNRYYAILCVTLAAFMFCGCEYDPPPEIESSEPVAGDSVAPDENIVIRFSEPIDYTTARLTLYTQTQAIKDEDGQLLPVCKKNEKDNCARLVFNSCQPGAGCPGFGMALRENGTELTLMPRQDMAIGNYLLSISPGLSDLNGNTTGVALELLFAVSPNGAGAPTGFESGVFITWLDLEEPLAYPLELYWIFNVDSENGNIIGSACDADAKDPSTTKHDNREQDKWYPWPYTYGEGYSFAFEAQAQDIEVDDGSESGEGYFIVTQPFRLYVGPPVEVEVLDGTIEVTVTFNEDLGRQELNGLINSPETYILSSKASGGTPEVASGVVYGYRLSEEEVEAMAEEYPDDWQTCIDVDSSNPP